MASIYDVDAQELVNKAAEELAKNENVKPPEWASFVKTGVHKERGPAREDWWYVRAAAVLRTIYRYGPIGVSKLRIKYGGKKRRGHQPAKFFPGSGSIIRKILQQLEKAGFLKKEEKMQHKGRRISSQGKSFLDKLATQLYKNSVKEAPKPVKDVETNVSKTSKEVEPKVEEKKVEKPAEKKESPKVEKKPEAKPSEPKEDGKVQTPEQKTETGKKA